MTVNPEEVQFRQEIVEREGGEGQYAAGAALRQASLWRDAVRRFTRNKAAVVSMLAFVGIVNFWTMVVALTVASWFTTARVMRGQIITLKENDYVRAARAIGARWYRILFRHLLPNTLGVAVVFVFLELPNVVLGEA